MGRLGPFPCAVRPLYTEKGPGAPFPGTLPLWFQPPRGVASRSEKRSFLHRRSGYYESLGGELPQVRGGPSGPPVNNTRHARVIVRDYYVVPNCAGARAQYVCAPEG